ncbi:MAG: amidase domain-containing protein [Solirubrobacterales bacterium]
MSTVDSSEDLQLLPDAEDVRQGVEAAAQEEAERLRWLESPEATRQREESRYAFEDLSADEVQELLLTAFSEQLAKLNDDPARWLSDASIVQQHGESVATVSENGDTSLLDAGGMPLRAEDEEGDLRKVDLSLEATPEGFEPANPLGELKIPDEADEPIEIGDRGIAIKATGADESRTAQLLGDKNVLYPEAQGPGTDTDRIVSPTGGGVEIFDLLRSPESPEVFRYEIEMPEGAELRSDGNRGAEVAIGDEVLSWIPFPVAYDAQGTIVPVELQIEGNAIALHITHREEDVAYPILLDPQILEDWVNSSTSWYNGHNLQALANSSWQPWSPAGQIYVSTYCIYACWGSGRGLFISAPSRNYAAGVFAHWAYLAPNMGSYIAKAWLIPFWRDDHGCSQSQYSQPHDYDGFWGDNQWNLLQTNQAINIGSVAVESWGRSFVFGLSSGGGVNIPCWRDLFVGGAAIWLDDWERPSLTTSSTDAWMDSSPVRLNVSATDGGLGVKSFEAVATTSSGSSQTWWTHHACTGLYEARCPGSWNLADSSQPILNFSPAALPEGLRKIQVTAYDVTGKPSYAMSEMTVQIDHAAPTVTFSGTVTEQATLGTEKPSYTFEAKAVDGVPGSPNPDDARSGATGLVFKNDGQVVNEFKPGCPTESCSVAREVEVPAATLPAGTHTLSVTATDEFGHTSPPKQLTYTTGDKKAPDLSVTGLLPESSTMPTRATYWRSFGNAGTGNGQFNHPADVAVDSNGNQWVVDGGNNRVQKFNQAGEFVTKFGSTGSANGQLSHPTSLAFDAKGNIWVTDAGNSRVQQFNEKGESLAKFGSKGTGNGQFAGAGPEGIAIDPKGNIWVADTYGGRVQKFNEKGEFLKVVGSKGSGTGQLGEPAGIDVGPNGDVWIADWQNNRVSVFNESGVFVRQFGSSGTGDGQFAHPGGIAVGAKGDVWVGDQNNGRVQEFNQNGAYVAQFGSKGSGEGQFNFSYPVGLATDSKGSLWVTDTNNNRVQRWLIPNSTVDGYLEPISATATDDGFGVTSMVVKLTDEAQSTEVLGETTQSCTKGACPLSLSLDEVDLSDKSSGAYILTVAATDAAGNVRNASRVISLDSAPPEIDLSGPLADSAGQPLSAASADLEISASDVDPASDGIKTINVERDSQLVASYVSNCSSDCHEVNTSYTYLRTEDGANRAIRPVANSSEGSVGELKRVSCAASDDCWAIGRTKYASAEQAEGKTAAPLLERWNGSEWQAVAVPKPSGATDAFLEGVSCNSASSCLAVGYYHNGSMNRPLVEIWNGTKWTAFSGPLPSGASGAYLYGISCSSTSWNSCWAYGRTQITSSEQAEGKTPAPFFLRWNGGAWQVVVAPKPEGATDAFLEGVSCRSVNACLAVGRYHNGSVDLPLVELWDGTKWSAASAPLPSGASGGYLDGISCSSASNCWAYGRTQVTSSEQAEGKTPTPFLARWTGSGWQTVAVPKPPLGTGTTLTAISCASDTACTAVGRYTNSHAETLPLAYTWSGTDWRFQPAPQPVEATTASLEGVSCTSANVCAMVGHWRIGSGKWNVLAETEAPGQGPHTIRVEAVDAQGNTESQTIEIDVPQKVAETPECDPEATSVGAKGVLSPGQAVDTLEESLPAAVAPSEGITQETTELEVSPSYTAPQPNLESEDSLADSETTITPEGGFALTDVACVVPEQTTTAATNASVVNQDAALFANTAPETDTVIRPTAAGATVVQSLRGPDAPTSLSWTVTVGSGQELVELPSGAVALVQDPLDGEPIEETGEAPVPKDAETEKALTDAAIQLENSEYQLAQAQEETTQEVVAVIAQPWVVLSESVIVPAKIEILPDVQVPIEWEVEVTLPQAAIEAQVYPVGLAMEFLSSFAANGKCEKNQSPCGTPDLDRAARYAVYWGNEDHNHARNNNYWDYGSNDCTNFISQILRAAGTKFMRYRFHGDGSWWAYSNIPPFGPPEYDDSESWKLADELPRHLWRFGLAHIDPVQQPWGWTKGNIIATDWFGTNGKGDINHLLFVVGTRDNGGQREPLLANHSTDSYSDKSWVVVKKRIEDAEGSNWTRFALAVKHTNANLNEKKHAPQNLYGPGGLFHG